MAYISLVTLGVQDVARSTAFYEALGWRKSNYSVDGVVSFLAGGTVALALYGRDALGNDAKVPATASYAVNAESPDAVDATIATAVSVGARVTAPAQRAEWGGYVGYFTDPDDHLWEVAHNPDWPLGDEGQVYLPGMEEHIEAARRETEAQISGFITGADSEAGRSVEQLATLVVETMRPAYDAVAAILGAQPNNMVIATMLALGQRSRQIPTTDADYWLTSAASSVASSLITGGRNA